MADKVIDKRILSILTGFPDRAVRQAIAHGGNTYSEQSRRHRILLLPRKRKPLVGKIYKTRGSVGRKHFHSLKAARDFLKGW